MNSPYDENPSLNLGTSFKKKPSTRSLSVGTDLGQHSEDALILTESSAKQKVDLHYSLELSLKKPQTMTADTLMKLKEHLDLCTQVSTTVGPMQQVQTELFELLPSQHDDHDVDGDHAAEALASAIRNCTGNVPDGGAAMKFSGYDFMDQWPLILSALASNERFTKWHLSNCNIDGDVGLAVARALEKSPQVRILHLRNNPLSGPAIEQIAKAALKCKGKFERLLLVDEIRVPLTPSVLSALVRLRIKFPEVELGSGSQGRLLESLVCMASLKNKEAETIVKCSQRDILEAFTKGDQEKALKIFDTLKKDVVCREHERLLKLFHGLNEKYAVIGGFEYMSMLPKDFDEYANAKAGQFIAAPLKDLSKETRVRHLLAMAEYKQPVLQSICHWISRTLQPLAREGGAAHANSTYIIPAVVDAFLVEHDLRNLTSEVLAYDVSCNNIPKPPAPKPEKDHLPPSSDPTSRPPAKHRVSANQCIIKFTDFLGVYVHSGFCNGLPFFCRASSTVAGSSPGCYLYYNKVQAEWNIGSTLNSSERWLFLPDAPGESPRPEPFSSKNGGEQWNCLSTGTFVTLSFKQISSQIRLREGLVSFLERRADNQDFCQLLSLGDELLRVEMGPPKDYARAFEKYPWLLDLNRCTLVLDSPIVMVLAFHLLKAKVEAPPLSGKISRLTNHFLKEDISQVNQKAKSLTLSGGALLAMMKQPPCIHLNVLLDGWTFEIMLILHDFMVAKESLHKFYELLRAESPVDVLKPVFEPLLSPDDIDACVSHSKFDMPEADPEFPSGSALQAVRAKSQT